jgi:hypothetical protein
LKFKKSQQMEYIGILEAQLRRLMRLQDEFKNDVNPVGHRLLARAIKTKADDLYVAMFEKAKR